MNAKLCFSMCILAVAISTSLAEMKCSSRLKESDFPNNWIDLRDDCYRAMRDQIQKEIDASYTYLAMGAHFSKDTINRPGFAEFFFKAAKEEREHGMKLIEYLSMRGTLHADVTKLVTIPRKEFEGSAIKALRAALDLETQVTQSIRGVIKTCENDGSSPTSKIARNEEGNYNHYHLVDYLTGVYLEEQLHGQRDIAGKLSDLLKMEKEHGVLSEYLYDKKM